VSQDKFARSLQEDLLTLLVHSEQHGKTISKIVKADLFEGDYRIFSERALLFWQEHNAPPRQHIADLLSNILEDKHDRRGPVYCRIIDQMDTNKDQINADYVLRSMGQFIRMQRFKAVGLEAFERVDAGGIEGLKIAEGLLRDFLNEQTEELDPGIRLSNIDKVLAYLEQSQNEFCTGIKELDKANIIPMRGKIMFLLAPTGYGKTWWLVQLGKMAFMQRKKVCHISLEIEAEEVVQRYYQSLFGASKRDEPNKISTFKLDRNGEVDQIIAQTIEPPFAFESEAIREELETRLTHYGIRAENIIIKRFPMRSLTVDRLEAYLESLEAVENFVPDMVIIDYPGIMKTDAKNHRISLGRLVEELRGLSQRRNFALAAAHQTNRMSVNAELVKSTHVAEDWSAIGTADFVITFSQTAAEKQRGLARLFVDKARSEADKMGVLITQSYRTGQFCIESIRLSDSYARIMEGMGLNNDDEDNTDDD
jgi:DnaB-like helicase C terminal domain